MIQLLIIILLVLAIVSIILDLFIALLPILVVGGIILYFWKRNQASTTYTHYTDTTETKDDTKL